MKSVSPSIWFFSSLLLALAGCKTTATVDYDHNMMDRMQNYSTYSVVTPKEQSGGQHLSLTEIVDRRIIRAIDQVMQARGLKRVDRDQDCSIAFFTTTEKHTQVQDLSLAGGYYRHGVGRGGWNSFSPITVDEYEEGTLVLDVMDSVSGQLAWRGASSRRLGHTAPSEGQILTAVKQILAEFPPSAE
ncbi:MAG: DUF4136 domain-containing protein [Coraliomargaritaceae bacterium]